VIFSKWLFLGVYFFTSVSVFSQDSLQRTSFYERVIPKHSVKWSPFHAVSFYPTIQVAYEHKLRERFTLQFEVGYVLTDWAFDFFLTEKYRNKQGAKVKLAGKYFHSPVIYSRSARYFSVEPYWNHVDFDRVDHTTECLDRDCNSSYTRRREYEISYREKGLSLKYGLMTRAGKLVMDLNVGLSFRFINYLKPEELTPGSAGDFFEGSSFGLPNESNRFGLSPTGGIRVGYAF
jgi:hypothetical protein